MSHCLCCDDVIDDSTTRLQKLADRDDVLQPGELAYCLACADELFRGRLDPAPAQLYSPGRGRAEGGPSPSFEDAVRSLEDC
jgi:hypothetical protein